MEVRKVILQVLDKDQKFLGSYTEPSWRKPLCTGAEKMLPFPWKWNPSIGVGGMGGKATRAQQSKAWKIQYPVVHAIMKQLP